MGADVDLDTAVAENYHVNLPIRGGAVSRSGQSEPVTSTPSRAAVFLPGRPASIEWRAGCAQFCLMIPRHVVQQELEAMLDRPVVTSIEFAPAMDVTTDAGRSWVDTLRLVERQTRPVHGLLDHPPAVESLQRLLVDGLLLAQRHNYTDALTAEQPPAAPPTVREAILQIRAHPEQPWTTAALARSVAVSARSLQYGFARSIGVPPMAYLRDVRLERIRDDLRSGDPHTTSVSRIAERWGVLDLSRLAAAYRRKFGETPSQTLRGT
jgi:transcriptional regulator GlxA family with amidase domain